MDKLFPPDTIIDDKLFEPCGYSMNGVIGDTDQYITIHITPEAEFSYVSFETNMSISTGNTNTIGGYNSYFDLITRVIQVFKPGRFLVTMFANQVRNEFVVWVLEKLKDVDVGISLSSRKSESSFTCKHADLCVEDASAETCLGYGGGALGAKDVLQDCFIKSGWLGFHLAG